MSSTRRRAATGVMYAGLGLTVIATLAPYADRATTHLLAHHIRSGYPSYSQAQVDSAVNIYLVLLSIIGALGVLAWFGATWAVKAGKRWARLASTMAFVLGAGVGLTGLIVKDTSGATGLPPALGWAGVAPCLAGAVAIVLLWRSPRHGHHPSGRTAS
ncbi:hypothetical protein B046DRAFT_04796 [Streptomyces sp. LamerLS-316]|uniref:hypothetical protein n=1 Tax=unclassified Streptomyces TaxID=2593676 RepID=UPI000823C37B|nr:MULTISPECIES: hypothetical protein [unclassified Streptomyces]SCK46716.1 hypothetical protein B046DRAFT_04796 [Streptomyces sp. LamerLS-316]